MLPVPAALLDEQFTLRGEEQHVYPPVPQPAPVDDGSQLLAGYGIIFIDNVE
jgi:hypothetical protein